jgi:hypothetical protein
MMMLMHGNDGPPSRARALTLVFRLFPMILAITSAVVMAALNECTARCGVTFSYDTCPFVFLLGCNITAAILEAAALYLEVTLGLAAAAGPADDEYKTLATRMEEEKGIGAAQIMLEVLDPVVRALHYSAMGVTFATAANHRNQIGACAGFAGQVLAAEILALAGSAAVMLAGIAREILRMK